MGPFQNKVLTIFLVLLYDYNFSALNLLQFNPELSFPSFLICFKPIFNLILINKNVSKVLLRINHNNLAQRNEVYSSQKITVYYL